MAQPAAVAGLVLEPQDIDLRAFGRAEDLGGDVDLGELLRVRGHRVTVDQKNCRQGHGRADLAVATVDVEDVTDGDLLLAAAAADNRVHRGLTLSNEQTERAQPPMRAHTDVGATRAGFPGYGRGAVRVKP